MSFAGFDGAIFCKSLSTDLLMVTKASQLFTKYRVNNLSPGLFSWGIILSAIQITLVCFLLIKRKIVPRQGPMKGIQNRTMTSSGFFFFSFNPTSIQFKGLIELIRVRIVNSLGGGVVTNCDFPGNKKPGYCNENDQISQL